MRAFLHQVDANPLTAAADNGNEELVHWLADECGVTPVYMKVEPWLLSACTSDNVMRLKKVPPVCLYIV